MPGTGLSACALHLPARLPWHRIPERGEILVEIQASRHPRGHGEATLVFP